MRKDFRGRMPAGLVRHINCGGYALRTNDWVDPEDDGYDPYDLDDMVAYHQDLFGLEVVGVFTPAEAEAYYRENLDTYILYRFVNNEYEDDFHWVTITKRCEYYSKSGRSDVDKGKVFNDKVFEVFADEWEHKYKAIPAYDSLIIMMKGFSK